MGASSRRVSTLVEYAYKVAGTYTLSGRDGRPVTLFAEDYDFLDNSGALKKTPDGAVRTTSGTLVVRGPMKRKRRGEP